VLELRTPSKAFFHEARMWHEDEDLNHWVGFGRGSAGIVLAQKALTALEENLPKDIRMFAAWDGAVPVGHVVFSDLDATNKSGDVHLTVAPSQQGKGYGPQILSKAVDIGMEDGLYRITYRPLVSNKRAIAVGLKAGFKVEARTKFSVWTIDGPQDQAQMRVTKPEWRKRVQARS